MQKFISVDKYIASFPNETQQVLQQLRNTIKKALPKAEEIISYGMPAYKQGSVLIYFAGYKKHIGLYPTSSGIRQFQKEIAGYKNSKGAVQFPLDKPLPLLLITKMATFRLKEVLENEKLKKTLKK
jgi:uncharacterized protein YdhG (YjbR/CyaY superfamily)